MIPIANSLSFAIQFRDTKRAPIKIYNSLLQIPPFPRAVQFKLHSYTPIFPWHSRKFHTYSELIFRGYSSRINWIQTKVSKQISHTESCQFSIRIRTFFDSYLNFSSLNLHNTTLTSLGHSFSLLFHTRFFNKRIIISARTMITFIRTFRIISDNKTFITVEKNTFDVTEISWSTYV